MNVRELVNECVFQVLKEDLGSSIIQQYRTAINTELEKHGFQILGTRPNLYSEYYLSGFATVSCAVFPEYIYMDRYYDSERMDSMYHKEKKIPLTPEFDQAIVDLVVKTCVLWKNSIKGDEPIFGGMDDISETSDMQQEDPKDAFYVQYHSQRQGEEPFMLGDRKFEYVNAVYPDGTVDIAVYAFAGDLCYGYRAFRKQMGINEGRDSGSEINSAQAAFNADIAQLKQTHPKISFGYIGNLTNDPRIGDNGDDRAWYVWNVVGDKRVKWGGFSTRDLPLMWKQWQSGKEKFLNKSAIAEAISEPLTNVEKLIIKLKMGGYSSEDIIKTTKAPWSVEDVENIYNTAIAKTRTTENKGRYAQLAGATDLKEARKDCSRCKGAGGYFQKIGKTSQPTTHWVACDMPGCHGGNMNSIENSLYSLFGTTEIDKVQDKDLQTIIDPTKTYNADLVSAANAELQKRAGELKEDCKAKTFQDIRNELDPEGKNHDLTLTCVKCGTTETCRCSKPKRKFNGVCPKCSQIKEDRFDIFRKELGAERVDEFLAKFGLGPKYKPSKPKTYPCPKCKKKIATYNEDGADCDGGQNEMVLECPECGCTQGQ